MTSQIQFVNTTSDTRLENLVREKLDKLERKFTWIVGATIYIKVENYSEASNKVCGIELSVPGPVIFIEEKGETHEIAIVSAFREAELVLKKHKDKMYSY